MDDPLNTDAAPVAAANTGSNDSGSIWGSGLLSTLGTVGSAAINKLIASPVNGTAAKTAATPSTTGAALQKYLPWAIGGVVALVLVVVLFKALGKK